MTQSRRLSIAQILHWADQHYRRRGKWPTSHSGPVRGGPDDLKWSNVEWYLRRWSEPGRRRSIARLLQEKRGKRNPKRLPPLRTAQVLRWCDGHFRRTGRWPIAKKTPIPQAPGETWKAIDQAM